MELEYDPNSLYKWYAVQTRSNMEQKAVEGLKRMIDVEDMGEYISKDDILMPEELVSEVKNDKKTTRKRKLYPGYIFIKVKLYDENENFLEKPWYFVRGINGIINFMGGDRPLPLRENEIREVFEHMRQSEGVEKPKVNFEAGEEVKITDGPFLSLVGVIDEVDPERGKLKVSVSIFGRFTPVELEYWQVEKTVKQ
ncbi:MAG: transcription termination/antitermination factor NusG [Verrucomicrobia bacterium]|nr:MAG: transcription termination/antitermination factor NusG [Verrucomicrobiota bacterium]